MLMQLGSVTFDVAPFNTHEYTRSSATDFARKDVVGARKPLEYVGEGEETYQIMGKLLPKRLGGLNEMAELHAMRQSGIALFLMRGDGMSLGWFAIESVEEKSSYLDHDGVGQQVDFTVSLVRAPRPSAFSFVATLFESLLR